MLFEFTSGPFNKSDDIIDRLKNKHHFQYTKGDNGIYSKTKQYMHIAIIHAARIQKYQQEASPDSPVYKYNPYTDIDKLIKNIKELEN